MLKFQEDYNIAHQSFEDLILVIFVLVDDLYKKVAPKAVKKRPNINKAILSDSEVITIALCGEIMGIDSEKAWYSFVKKNYRHLFPKMCDRSQFNRTRRNLMQVMNLIFTQIATNFVKHFGKKEQPTAIMPQKKKHFLAIKYTQLQYLKAQLNFLK